MGQASVSLFPNILSLGESSFYLPPVSPSLFLSHSSLYPSLLLSVSIFTLAKRWQRYFHYRENQQVSEQPPENPHYKFFSLLILVDEKTVIAGEVVFFWSDLCLLLFLWKHCHTSLQPKSGSLTIGWHVKLLHERHLDTSVNSPVSLGIISILDDSAPHNLCTVPMYTANTGSIYTYIYKCCQVIIMPFYHEIT